MTRHVLLASLSCVVLVNLQGCDFGCAPDPVIASADYQVVGGSRPELMGALVNVTDWGLVIVWTDAEGSHTGVYEYGGADYYDSGDAPDSGAATGAAD